MKRTPDVHDSDERDYEAFLRGGFRPDPEIEKWHKEFRLAISRLGFEDYKDIAEIESMIKPDYGMDVEEFVALMRFCSNEDCNWVGMVDELVRGTCPDCGKII